ncbi:MAG: hypothetical protein LBT86_00275 [Deltaproteobacteria bacterium]|jgi:tetratricopeptide (TPR) repeat protein|nr:hypothetical protein [Deltaproteobacteria bacterium]
MPEDQLTPPEPIAADATEPPTGPTDGSLEVSAQNISVQALLTADGEHKNPRYRGLYLLGPLPDSRGQAQDRYGLGDEMEPYPPELEMAIGFRDDLLKRLEILNNTKNKFENEEFHKTLHSLNTLTRRLAMRWDKLRTEKLKFAKIQPPGWLEFLTSLNLRHRFLTRSIFSLEHYLEQAARPGPRNVTWVLIKTAKELQNALPELPDLANLELPPLKRPSQVRKAIELVLRVLEKERLRVLDRILVTEDLLTRAKTAGVQLEAPPEPEEVPKVSTEVVMPGRVEPRPLKTLTWITVILLVVVLVYFFVSRSLNHDATTDRSGRLLIINGLATSINVFLDNDKPISLGPNSAHLVYSDQAHIKAQTFMTDGPFIEELQLNPPMAPVISTTLIYNVAGAAPLVERMGTREKLETLSDQPPLPLGAPRILFSQANYFLPIGRWGIKPIALWRGASHFQNVSGISAIAGEHPDLVLGSLKSARLPTGGRDRVFFGVLAAQSTHNPTWDEWTSLWLSRLVQIFPKQSLKILKARWDVFPNDMITRKFLFDMSNQVGRTELCQDIMARLAMESERAYDQYLLTWCLPIEERSVQLKQQLGIFLNDLWLLSALGRTEFDQGNYLEAYRIFKQVLRQDSWKMVFEIENLARLEHYLGRTGFEIFDDLGGWAPDLSRKAYWEEGEDPDNPDRDLGPDRAYHLLAQGRVAEALAMAEGEFRHQLAPLVATSEGVEPRLLTELVAETLNNPPEKGLTTDNAWSKLALYIKLGEDSQKIEEFILERAVDRRMTTEILANLKNHNVAKIQELLVNQNARTQGDVCLVLALTAEDPQDPVVARCLAIAKGFLFSSERPYLK